MDVYAYYLSTCKYVILADPSNRSSWEDLYSYLPCLRQMLSCCVCGNIMLRPKGPGHGFCLHHVCASCIGGKMRLRPVCSWCRSHQGFVENPGLRLLILCFKKMCVLINSGSIGQQIRGAASNGSHTNTLVRILDEAVAFEDDYAISNKVMPTCVPTYGMAPEPKFVSFPRGSQAHTSAQRSRSDSTLSVTVPVNSDDAPPQLTLVQPEKTPDKTPESSTSGSLEDLDRMPALLAPCTHAGVISMAPEEKLSPPLAGPPRADVHDLQDHWTLSTRHGHYRPKPPTPGEKMSPSDEKITSDEKLSPTGEKMPGLSPNLLESDENLMESGENTEQSDENHGKSFEKSEKSITEEMSSTFALEDSAAAPSLVQKLLSGKKPQKYKRKNKKKRKRVFSGPQRKKEKTSAVKTKDVAEKKAALSKKEQVEEEKDDVDFEPTSLSSSLDSEKGHRLFSAVDFHCERPCKGTRQSPSSTVDSESALHMPAHPTKPKSHDMGFQNGTSLLTDGTKPDDVEFFQPLCKNMRLSTGVDFQKKGTPHLLLLPLDSRKPDVDFCQPLWKGTRLSVSPSTSPPSSGDAASADPSMSRQKGAGTRKVCLCAYLRSPSQETCCSQHCPCFLSKLPCVSCMCRGCRNPRAKLTPPSPPSSSMTITARNAVDMDVDPPMPILSPEPRL